MARIYSISTLLKLGQLEQPAHVELRISPAALAENVFKISSAPPRPKLQENLHPRRQTQSSNLTGRSTNSEEEAVYDGTYIRPIRQPFNPPEVSLIQKHAGFARFLKQHASPPHHRVTAGGRIVPAGPLSPPPMMCLPSINTVVTNSSKSLGAKPQGNLPETDRKASNNPKTPLGTISAPLTQQNVNINTQKSSSIPPLASQGIDAVANTQYMRTPLTNHLGPYLGPLPIGATPIGFLPDGSSIVFLNGMNYQSSWDGSNATLKPLHLQMPGISQTGFTSAAFPHTAVTAQSYGFHCPNGLASQQDTSNGSNFIQGQPQQLEMAQPEDPGALYGHLSSELSALDKYVALHLHEFSQVENTHYTSRRRQLVEQLDSLRVGTENNGPLNSLGAPSYGPQAAPLWTGANGFDLSTGNVRTTQLDTVSNFAPVSGQLSGIGLPSRLAPSQTLVNKGLSPAAPPFIPAGAKAAVPDYSATGQHPRGSHLQNWGIQGHAGNVGNTGHSAYQVHDQGNKGSLLNSGNGSGSLDSARIRSNIEPRVFEALPAVTPTDIEYANQPGFNPRDRPKLYCSTIGEFQEVLRRVREQAELYGCKGGQSKDPAYDAEQDIRWAMADGEPIPLPKSPADHVANPRPWSWDDSAFNYRPEIAINPIGAENKVGHQVHQRLESFIGNKARARVNNWANECGMEDGARETTVVGRSAHHTSELSSRSPYREKPLPSGIHDVNRSYPGGTVGRSISPMLISRHTLQGTSRPNGNLKLTCNRSQQYQPYIEDAPETPAKSKPYLNGFSERSQATRQVWASPNQEVGRCGQGMDRFNAIRRDSWDSDTGTNDSWLSTSNKDFQLFLPGKHKETSQTRQQGFCKAPPPYGRASCLTETPAPESGMWTRSVDKTDRDSDALSFDSQGIPRSDYNHPTNWLILSLSGVKLCKHLQARQTIKRGNTARSIVLLGFLRGMLKSPRYSVARTHQSEPYDLTQHQMRIKRVDQGPEERYANKENIRSEGHQDMINWFGRGLSRDSEESSKPRQSAGSETVINKARSSLAASSYHAFGQLPQYDGAGEALMSSNHQAHSTNSQINGSSPRRQNTDNRRAKPSEDLLGGQAPSRAEQAKAYDVGRTDSYDYRGLTRNDFTAAPDRPQDIRVHGEQVDRYFDRLYEDEVRELGASYEREAVTQRRF
ncbi:MAG: hypothetical protein Q9225_005766 [Loekoesia sp. 1 TL-2023]